jgi:5-methylcytosine-specific restriction endonuclease McrA
MAVPEVICLTRFDRLPSTAVTFSRRNVARRDHQTCQYCGAQPGWESITVDHVVPRSRGGTSSWTNCVAACVACNARKADRTPEQAGMKLRRRPARPDWKPLYAARAARVESWARFLDAEPTMAMA